MLFYKIEMCIEMNALKDESDDRRHRFADRDNGRKIAQKCEKLNERIIEDGFFFLSNITDDECTFGLILRNSIDLDRFMARFFKEEKIDASDVMVRETTLYEFKKMLDTAERQNYVFDEEDLLMLYELGNLTQYGFGRLITEKLISEKDKKEIYVAADSYFTKETFLPELDRIYQGKASKKVCGHPVEYIIESDDERTIKGMSVLLVQALYGVGRIENRRYSVVDLEPDMHFPKKAMEELYKSSYGGAVILNLCEIDDGEEERSKGEYYYMDDLGRLIRSYCCNVLTVVCMPRECRNTKMSLFENVGNCSFVEIKENLAMDDEAVEYLQRCAKKYKVRSDNALVSTVERGRGYLTPELNEIFEQWYGDKLKNSIYRQYRDIGKAKSEVKDSKPKGDAYSDLMGMIGIQPAKEMICRALDCYKANKMFKDKGMQMDSMCNHMIFTGNPGTAKTTVARLFSRILKDNGVLSKGHIVEVGRGDLVGRYVGWTAPTIKKKFQQAKGGVLFIDEAYSLVDDRDGSYGDEAINTIVQEMENHRDDMIVIFAGYTDKMEGFLDKNPGLRSRIAHYIQFEDYSTDELCLIAEHIAKKMGLILNQDAKEKIREVMRRGARNADFGNGRYARNVIEKARMLQSSRLVRMDYEDVTSVDVKTILAEDIEIPRDRESPKRMKIGFSA